MRTMWLDTPKELLEERRRLGLDGRDEMWDGVLHVVPPAGAPHQRLGGDFYLVVAPLAKRRGLLAFYEPGLYDTEDDYRVPDQLYCRSEQLSERAAEGAEIVVGIRSPGDETYDADAEDATFSEVLGVRFRIVEGVLRIS